MDENTGHTQGRASLNSQHNVRATAVDNTIEHKAHTPSPRTEIKIPDLAGNRTQAAGLEDRDTTDHAKGDLSECGTFKCE